MFTKEEILQRRAAELETNPNASASLHLALLIATCALYEEKQWDGTDYLEHPLIVGMNNTRSMAKKIIGILHDVVEDSDWTLDDLRAVGFSKRIVDGVDAVTKRAGEKYLDFVERCSLNPDGIDIKINDLLHNMDISRNPEFPTDRALAKQKLYTISYQYLLAIKREEIAPGTKMSDFIHNRPELSLPNDVMAAQSSHWKPSASGMTSAFKPSPSPQ
jgi:(p)ppGpp synthase/HD superfamily hydrolase